MSKISTSPQLTTKFKSLLGLDYNVETITGFSDKKSALEHVKQNYPNYKTIDDGELFIDTEDVSVVLCQIDPETNKTLVAYKSMYGFCTYNDLSYSQLEKATKIGTEVSGYLWQTKDISECVPTTWDYTFIDPLNKGFDFVLAKHGTGRGTVNNIAVNKIDKNGNIVKKYPSRKKAAEDHDITPMKLHTILKKNLLFNNHYFTEA
jgi:hypothetical protein